MYIVEAFIKNDYSFLRPTFHLAKINGSWMVVHSFKESYKFETYRDAVSAIEEYVPGITTSWRFNITNGFKNTNHYAKLVLNNNRV